MPVRRVLLNDCKYLKKRDIDLFSVFVWRVKDLTGMAGACLWLLISRAACLLRPAAALATWRAEELPTLASPWKGRGEWVLVKAARYCLALHNPDFNPFIGCTPRIAHWKATPCFNQVNRGIVESNAGRFTLKLDAQCHPRGAKVGCGWFCGHAFSHGDVRGQPDSRWYPGPWIQTSPHQTDCSRAFYFCRDSLRPGVVVSTTLGLTFRRHAVCSFDGTR